MMRLLRTLRWLLRVSCFVDGGLQYDAGHPRCCLHAFIASSRFPGCKNIVEFARTMSTSFTFAHASKPSYLVAAGANGSLGFRPDLNRRAQLDTVARDLKEKKAHSDWAEYMKTWDTQHSHERYLRCLLNEAHRYQATHCAKSELLANSQRWKVFVKRLNKLADEVTELMGSGRR